MPLTRMEIKEKTTIHDICVHLRDLAKNEDDIFVLSFTAPKVTAHRIYNKGDGREGIEIKDFSKLKNIIFTDTVNKLRTNLIDFMKANKFNEKNGDGELIIAFDGRTRTFNMIGLHNTNLGPGLGGLREKDYSNFDSMATDTLRLAKGMTYKSAIAQTRTGGGKATRTIPKGIRKEANLGTARICNFINQDRLKRNVGIYVVAEDSNTSCADIDQMDPICPNNTCKSLALGGTGNPSPITALGVYHAAKKAAEFAFKDKTLKDKVVMVSGVGEVGYEVLKNFVANDVKKVICAEMTAERIKWVKDQLERAGQADKVKFMVYTKEELISQKFLHDLANEIDIFAPCALGRSINDSNINAIKDTRLKMICGAENNQLADEEKHGKMLHDMGILYVPDFVVNGGGLIHCAEELDGRMFLLSSSIKNATNIENTVKEVLEMSQKEDIPTYLAANKIAEKRFLK